MNTNTITRFCIQTDERNLIYDFLLYLISKKGVVKTLELLYGQNQEIDNFGVSSERESKMLMKYKKENGCLPEKVQIEFNEWLLTERL